MGGIKKEIIYCSRYIEQTIREKLERDKINDKIPKNPIRSMI